jgi:hypothetical protein
LGVPVSKLFDLLDLFLPKDAGPGIGSGEIGGPGDVNAQMRGAPVKGCPGPVGPITERDGGAWGSSGKEMWFAQRVKDGGNSPGPLLTVVGATATDAFHLPQAVPQEGDQPPLLRFPVNTGPRSLKLCLRGHGGIENRPLVGCDPEGAQVDLIRSRAPGFVS